MLKRLARSDAGTRVLSWFIQLYIRLIWVTNRWTVEGLEHPAQLNRENRPYIGAFWHGRLLMMPYGWPRVMPLHMLISAHRDGRLIANAVRYFGIDIIAGSSRRGGRDALRLMMRALGNGHCVAVTPDGPDGPAMSAGEGAIQIARLAQAPIAPITYATSRRLILDSWDRFHLPLPFGRGVILIGEPIFVPREADGPDIERFRRQVEATLRELTNEADRRMGHDALEPGSVDRHAFRAMRRVSAGGRG